MRITASTASISSKAVTAVTVILGASRSGKVWMRIGTARAMYDIHTAVNTARQAKPAARSRGTMSLHPWLRSPMNAI